MGEQGPRRTGARLEPARALAGEVPVAREVAVGVGLGDVPEFLAGHVGFIEGDSDHD